MSPTQRSLALLRKEGWLAESVERWNAFTKTRRDLFKFIDIVAIRGNETLAIQTTSGTNVSARIEKIKLLPAADNWMLANSRTLEVHGWRRVGPRGKRKLWECRRIRLSPNTPVPQPTEPVEG